MICALDNLIYDPSAAVIFFAIDALLALIGTIIVSAPYGWP